jgi:membrane protein
LALEDCALSEAIPIVTRRRRRAAGGGSERDRNLIARRTPLAVTATELVDRFDRFQQRHAPLAFLVAVQRKYAEDRGGYLAAIVTYYAFFSLFPLLLVATTVLGYVLRGHAHLQREIGDSVLAQLPIVGHDLRVHALSGSGIALAAGITTSLWAATAVFSAAGDVAAFMWGVSRERRFGFLRSRVRALILVLVLGSGAVAVTALSLAGDRWTITLSLIGDFVLFWVGSRLLTAGDVGWRQLAGGAAAGSVAWELLQSGGAAYVRRVLTIASNTYGTFAVVIGLLSFMYLSVLVGVVVTEANVVAVRKLWPRSLSSPVEGVLAPDPRSCRCNPVPPQPSSGYEQTHL